MSSEQHALDPEVPQYYRPGESDSGFTRPLPLCSTCKAGADADYLNVIGIAQLPNGAQWYA